ncbi:hypothetical protein [Pseudomonas sp. DSV-1]|uniref:hypothetical protein n=1 Tax=Pseudomonas sp. DSV-1 TaxID=3112250 RepID=UPI002DB98C7B|nr:hypothetical protein [Pseudomonas sp. DSV-1]MEC4239198.1 hypothetical protein [Pseudomonas sp. DSV-1]
MSKSNRSIQLFFFYATFCAAYVDFPILLSGLVVPSFLVLVFSIPLVLTETRNAIKRPEFKKLMLLLAFLTISTIFFGEFTNISERSKGLLQTATAIYISYISYSYLARNPSTLNKASQYCLAFIVLFSITEAVGVTKELSDSFRNYVFSTDLVNYLYTSSDRDLSLAGFERPKVFTAEPSYAAIVFFTMSVVAIKTNPTRKTFLLLMLSCVAMAYLYRSPIIYSTACVIIYIYKIEKKLYKLGSIGGLLLILALAVTAWFLPSLLEALGRPLLTGDLNSLELNSQTIRFLVPIHTSLDVLSNYPLFGVGLTGKETIEAITTLYVSAQSAMGTNSVFTLLMYFGALGAAIYIFLFFSLLKTIDKHYLITIVPCITIYANMLGGYETVKYWFFMFIIFAAYKKSNPKTQSPDRQPHTTTH